MVRCRVCYKNFKSIETLSLHMKKSHPLERIMYGKRIKKK
jgi:hypothetical protein